MTRGDYRELIEKFPLRPIRSERQLERASKIASHLAVRKSLSRSERDYLEVLSDLIEKYENEHHRLDETVSGREALVFLIEENNMTLSRLASESGIRVSTLSEIAGGKRELSIAHIRKLCAYFRVDAGLFIQPAMISE